MRILLLFLTIILALYSIQNEELEKRVNKLVPQESIKVHKKLLDILFKEDQKYLNKNNEVDIVKIIKVLKENGLLKLFYKQPTQLKARFVSTISGPFLIKAISDSLSKLGYQYILTDELIKNGSKINWDIVYTSEHAIDPVELYLQMKKYHIDILDISTNNNQWNFVLEEDLDELYLFGSNKIYISELPKKFMSINGEFWFYLADSNALLAFIDSIYPDFWYPNVVFYDKNLKIKKLYKSQKPIRKIKLFLPKGTKYIKVTDSLMPQNLKHGINIRIEDAR